jgi:NAD(P)-dependent dehydrogenase (short-subunit alcohol dehydrogenase family)
MLEVNATGPYRCIREVLPGMLERKSGRIVSVASSAGLRGYPYVTAYTAAKHALVGLTRALALEIAGTGVTVNAVCPGYVDTPMTDRSVESVAAATGRAADDVRARLAAQNPIGRLVRPDEVAVVVVELCLPEAATRTGEAIPVGGPF